MGKFKGCVIFPRQEQRQGILSRNNKKTTIKLKARGDYQFEPVKKKWQIVPRGEESDILRSLDRTITNAEFQLISENKDFYVFQFRPHLSFLDPTFMRKFIANFTIDKKTLLPTSIVAQDSAQKILWQLDFYNYNKVKKIDFPFQPTTRITLSADRKLSKDETKSVFEVIKNRLAQLGELYQCKNIVKNNISLFVIELQLLEQNPDIKSIKSLLTNTGHLTITTANDTNVLLDNDNITSIDIIGTEPYPTLELTINQSDMHLINSVLSQSNQSVSFKMYLDIIEIGSFDIDKSNFSGKINILIFTNKNEIMNTLAIIKGGMLKTALSVYEIDFIR